jgi:HSP20 family protein
MRCDSLPIFVLPKRGAKKMSYEREPLRNLFRLQDRMNQVFDELIGRPPAGAKDEVELERADWQPPADVDEHEKEYAVSLDLPGIDRSQLAIELEKDRLRISGARIIEKRESRVGERPSGRFVRRFEVPGNVDQSGITADYKDGVLTVRLPKREQEKAGRVKIQIQ